MAAREIRVAAHDRGIYRGRVIIATTALLATSWILYSIFQFTGQASSMVGVEIFAFQAWAAFVFASGAFTTTYDSISREKREDTLGLLFLTHLKGRDVILGKLISGLSLFFTGAIATLPILTLPILMGGVRLSQSLQLLVSLLNTMLLSAAAGLFASSISVNKQKAGTIAMAIVVFFCVAIPIAVLSINKLGYLQFGYILQFFTPLFSQELAAGSLAGLQLGYFWTSIALIFSISCALLAAASFITPRTWQQRATDPLVKRLTERYAAWTLRTIRSRSALGRALLDRNAYEWLAAHELSASKKTWTFIASILLIAIALILNFSRHNELFAVLITVCMPVAYILQMNVKIRVGGHACDRFTQDRECNALELIFCTPLSLREMIAGEFAALRRHYLWPMAAVIALLFLGLYLSIEGLDHIAQLFSQSQSATYRWQGLAVVFCTVFFLFLDSFALAWMGVCSALTFRKIHHARGNTVTPVLAGPLILFCAIMPIILKSAAMRAFFENAAFGMSIFLITLFVTACDFTVVAFARMRIARLDHYRRSTAQVISKRPQSSLRERVLLHQAS